MRGRSGPSIGGGPQDPLGIREDQRGRLVGHQLRSEDPVAHQHSRLLPEQAIRALVALARAAIRVIIQPNVDLGIGVEGAVEVVTGRRRKVPSVKRDLLLILILH